VRDVIERKNRARQSPYPTVIIEVKAEPMPDGISAHEIRNVNHLQGVGALSDDKKKLESIFALSAAIHKRSANENEDVFYDAIGRVSL